MLDIKREMKDKARLARGLVNSLEADIDYVSIDIDTNNILCVGSSIRETKATLQQIADAMTELECLLYVIKKSDS